MVETGSRACTTTELHHQSPVLSETLLSHITSFLREGLSVQLSLTLDLTP